jgi:CRISPR-associated protein Cas1
MSVAGVHEVPLLRCGCSTSIAYCPRLFHLEWVQSEWADNAETLDGARVHQRVDKPSRRGLPEGERRATAVIRSVDLGGRGPGG